MYKLEVTVVNYFNIPGENSIVKDIQSYDDLQSLKENLKELYFLDDENIDYLLKNNQLQFSDSETTFKLFKI